MSKRSALSKERLLTNNHSKETLGHRATGEKKQYSPLRDKYEMQDNRRGYIM